jgi:glycosyltransferase involved in cell wall biosynthesis
MPKPKIWLLTEVFFPDIEIASGNIMTEIALELAKIYEVHVICGPKDYDLGDGKFNEKDDEVVNTVTIHRIKLFNLNKNRALTRVLRLIGISIGMFFIAIRKIRKFDQVLMLSNPPFITLFMAILRRFRKFQFYILMHDVFPENLVPGGYFSDNNPIYRCLLKVFVICRSKADKIIVLGRDMKSLIIKNTTKKFKGEVVIIPNWADNNAIYPHIEFNDFLINKLNLKDKIIIEFAGNHGILQNLNKLFILLKEVKNDSLAFVFAGGGSMKRKLRDYVRLNEVGNIYFLPSFPRDELNKYLNGCSIGLVSLSDDICGVGVPSKSYNIFSAGKPILFLGNRNSEIARMVCETKTGWVFEYKDSQLLIEFLNNLSLKDSDGIEQLGKEARKIVCEEYNKDVILAKYVDLFNSRDLF